MVRVVIERAEGLRNVDIFSKSDPFVQGFRFFSFLFCFFSFFEYLLVLILCSPFFLVIIPGTTAKIQTTTKDNNLNPEWNEEFIVYVYSLPPSLSFFFSSLILLSLFFFILFFFFFLFFSFFSTQRGGQILFLLYDEETMKHVGDFLGEVSYNWSNPTTSECIRQSSVCILPFL